MRFGTMGWGASRLFAGWTTIVLICLSQSLPAGPGNDARALVRDLGSDSQERRDEAEKALLAIGEPAAAVLEEALEDPDPEIRSRAERIWNRLALATASERREIDRWVAALKEAKDVSAAREAFARLTSLGPAGERAVQALFADQRAADPKDFEIALELGKSQYERGEPIEADVLLTNKGKRPVWIFPAALAALHRTESGLLIPAHPGLAMDELEKLHQANRNRLAFDLLYLEPGGSYACKRAIDPKWTATPGHATFVLDYDARRAHQSLQVGAIWLNLMARDLGGAEDAVRDARPEPTPLAIRAEKPFLVRPPLASDDGLSATASLLTKTTNVMSNTSIPFTLHLAATRDMERPLLWPGKEEEGFGQCVWAALLAEGGEVVALRIFTDPRRAKFLKLKQGESVEWKGELHQDLPAGRYSFVCGYSGKPIASLAQKFLPQMLGNADVDDKALWKWDAVSAKIPVTITARSTGRLRNGGR